MNDQEEIKIDKGVPMPAFGSVNRTGVTQVMSKMEIGDSFECGTENRSTIQSSARYKKIKIATRKTGENKMRVWRIA